MGTITGNTKLLCVIGSPVKHSISPAMHNEAIRLLNLDYVYTAFDVDEDHMEEAVRGLKTLGARGFNVTMPGKTILADLSDTLSPAAELSHSVNTVVLEDGKIQGHSTDGYGFMESLREIGSDPAGKKLTILGAGGAANSIIVQAALDGVVEISVMRRQSAAWEKTLEFTEKVAHQTGCHISVYDVNDQAQLRKQLEDSAVLCNATNVGMNPHPEGCLIPDSTYLHKSLTVFDIIYNPMETRLLTMAREAGCKSLNGLPMLLHQGAAAFRLFTGQEMPIELVRRKVFPNS